MNLKSEKLRVFIPHEKYVWLACEIVNELSKDEYSIDITDEDAINDTELKTNFKIYRGSVDSLPLQNIDKPENGVDDMTSLNFLHEASILHNLRHRFISKLPYTYVGNICIAVNPYQWLRHLYSDKSKDLHTNFSRFELPPHVYGTSASAYKELRDLNKNQSILVSGESGAGKTETVKILMAHLAHISSISHVNEMDISDSHGEVIEKVLQSNPLLESFGNAKTARNDNSSRFGKFTQLQFDPITNILIGSRCVTYLLEKSRVITQNDRKERNYHIFHQMFAAFETVKEKLFHVSTVTMRDFRYTSSGDSHTHSIEGVPDSTRYLQTMQALDLLGINETDRFQLQCILVGILYLGQIIFYGDNDRSYIDPTQGDITSKCCELLGLEVHSFCEKTTVRTIDVAGEEMIVHLSREQATDARDALAKDIYERLFLWLVNEINGSTSKQESLLEKTVSLLDIFGFESFQTNRFEQLNINYANEKLQQKFVQDVFSSVQLEYQAEGLNWEMITYKDNSDILELLEGKSGVFSLLNEECNLPQGNDMKYLTKLLSYHQKSLYLTQTVHMSKDSFSVSHYAGKVTYSVIGFVERNRDNLPLEMKTLMLTSTNDIITAIFNDARPRSGSGSDSMVSVASTAISSIDTASATRRPTLRRSIPVTPANSVKKNSSYLKAESVTTKFKSQLSSLMDTISRTNVQYVRCIKPNSQKSSTLFDRLMVVEQLRCAGMIEAIRISRAAYPYRLTHHEFIGRFGYLIRNQTNLLNSLPNRCESLLKELLGTQSQLESFAKSYEVGKTRIYFTAGTLEMLENVRGKLIRGHTLTIQKTYRRFYNRRRYLKTLGRILVVQSVIRRYVIMKRYIYTLRRVIAVQSMARRRSAIKFYKNMRIVNAILQLQKFTRMKQARKNFVSTYKKIIIIQSIVRTFIFRRRYVIKISAIRRDRDMVYQINDLKLKLEQESELRKAFEEETNRRYLLEKETLEHHLRQQIKSEYEELLLKMNSIPDIQSNHVDYNITSTNSISDKIMSHQISETPHMSINSSIIKTLASTEPNDDNSSSVESKTIEDLKVENNKLSKKLAYLDHENKAVKAMLASTQLSDEHEIEISLYKKKIDKLERELDASKAENIRLTNQINNYKVEKLQMLETWNLISSELETASRDRDSHFSKLSKESQLRAQQAQLTLLFLTSKGLDPIIVQDLKAMYDTMTSPNSKDQISPVSEENNLNARRRRVTRRTSNNFNLDYESSVISSVSTHRQQIASPGKRNESPQRKKSKNSSLQLETSRSSDDKIPIVNDTINKESDKERTVNQPEVIPNNKSIDKSKKDGDNWIWLPSLF